MNTYIIKEHKEKDAKGNYKPSQWGIYDGERLVNGYLSDDRLERVDYLYTLYSLKWCDVTDKQKWEFRELGYE